MNQEIREIITNKLEKKLRGETIQLILLLRRGEVGRSFYPEIVRQITISSKLLGLKLEEFGVSQAEYYRWREKGRPRYQEGRLSLGVSTIAAANLILEAIKKMETSQWDQAIENILFFQRLGGFDPEILAWQNLPDQFRVKLKNCFRDEVLSHY